jgi:hypothetical protein
MSRDARPATREALSAPTGLTETPENGNSRGVVSLEEGTGATLMPPPDRKTA